MAFRTQRLIHSGLYSDVVMKIIADNNIPFLRGRIEGAGEVEYVDQWGFTPELVKEADALLIRTRTRCDEKLLGDSRVRLIATATIGMDQIDRDWCAEQGIKVRNAPGCNAPGVAQYVWSALLRLGIKAGDTVGIVGCGNVGSIVRDWGKRLGVNILISDPLKEEAGEAGIYTPLEELLERSDAVTLHTPLTRDVRHATYHLIGKKELGLIGTGKIIVNAARGPVVDFSALKREVCGGRLRAVIDTWEGEPEVDEELLKAAAYGTFHIAGYSREGKERATRMVLEALEEEFGIRVDKSGLSGRYSEPAELTAEKITASYDPMVDTRALRGAPGDFDRLRRDYHYRREV